jgi:nucleoside-diphosphate-sugar epimerase
MRAESQQNMNYQPGVALEDLQLILAKTPASVWQSLQGQRIFITGGTGFVGCWLMEALIWANQELNLGLSLSVLSRQPDAFRAKVPHLATHPIVRLMQGNVTDLQHINEPYDVVIHAATDVVKPDTDPRTVFDDIVDGTKQTLALATRCHAKRYLLTSSGAVYGRQPTDVTHMPESFLGAPDTMQTNTAYGQGKRIAEWMARCHADQHGLDIKIARCFAFVGPYMALDAQFAIGNFIRDSLKGVKIQVGGDGTPYRSYLYAADLIIWLLTILIDGKDRVYNVGSSKQISIAELAKQVSLTLTGAESVAMAKEPVPGKPPEQYVPATLLCAALGLEEYTDITDAVQRTASWHQRNKACNQ